MCTGTPVYRSDSPSFIHDLLEKEAPSAASRQSPWPYPPSLDALISHLLSKSVSDRKLSVLDVKEQLMTMLQFLQKSEQYSKTEEFNSSILHQVRNEVQIELEDRESKFNEVQQPIVFKSSKTSDALKPVKTKKNARGFLKMIFWVVCGVICAYLISSVCN